MKHYPYMPQGYKDYMMRPGYGYPPSPYGYMAPETGYGNYMYPYYPPPPQPEYVNYMPNQGMQQQMMPMVPRMMNPYERDQGNDKKEKPIVVESESQ